MESKPEQGSNDGKNMPKKFDTTSIVMDISLFKILVYQIHKGLYNQ